MARREAILAATCAVICRDGIDGVRTAAVAAEAGMSSPIIHYYFPTLDDLVLAAYRWDEERLWGPLDAIAPDALLRELIGGVFDRPEGESRAALRLWLEFARRGKYDPAIRELVVLRVRRWGAVMDGLLGEAAHISSIRLAGVMAGWGALQLLDVVDRDRAGAEAAAAVERAPTWRVTGTPVASAGRPPLGEGDRSAAILDAALEVTAERGLRHAEFRAIAAEAGVSAALPRYYHRSMPELHEAMLLHAARRESERIAAAAAPCDDPRDRVRAVLAGDLDGADAHRRWSARTELLHLGFAEPSLRPLAALPLRDLATVLTAELDEARRRGLTAPALDPAGAALRLTALRHGVAPGWLVGAVERREFVDALLAAVDDELGV